MNPILTTGFFSPRDIPCIIEIDEFVPLRFRTYDKPIGSVYINIGNRTTTLGDIIADPISRVLRAFTLTSFESFTSWPTLDQIKLLEGLPVLSGAWDDPGVQRLEYSVVDASVEFSVSMRGNEILVFWDDIQRCTQGSVFRNVQCYATDRVLGGIRFFDLSDRDIALLASHGKRSGH
jgi:hypothetical protein